MTYDAAPLEARLKALALNPSSETATTTAIPLQTYFFKPKTGSKHPDQPERDLALIVVTLEEGKDVGSASSVAKKVGIKDMRAIGAEDVLGLIGRKREEGK